jgi:hypothetical protein
MGLFNWLFGRPTPDRQPLTTESLGPMLHSMGYVHRPNEIGFVISIVRAEWETIIQLGVNPDGKRVWLFANLCHIPDLQQVKAPILRRVLQETWACAPVHFAVHSMNDHSNLYLQRALDNRGITPVRLRKAIEEFDDVIRRTVPIWDPRNFGPPPAGPDTSFTAVPPV